MNDPRKEFEAIYALIKAEWSKTDEFSTPMSPALLSEISEIIFNKRQALEALFEEHQRAA